uniref:BESS domain-containing protein n=1 Tax=Heliothis virescens TaxID=7102 RepID=A0A2A4J0Z5_HELVI
MCDEYYIFESLFTAKAVQARWKTARDAFMKCINDNGKKFTYRGKSNYVHYNILTFLQKVKDYEDDSKKDPFGLPINQEDTQFEDEDAPVLSNDDDDTEDIDFNMDMNDSDANPDLPDPEVSTNVTDTADHSEPGTSNIDNEDDSVPPPKRGRKHRSPMPRGRKRKCDMSEFESKLLKILAARNESKANSVLPEDDQNFFNSLAPMMKDFNNYQKLHFRSKVLEIIREVQSVSSVKVKNEPICLEINNANSEDSDHILTESVVTFQYSSVN